MKNDRFHFEFSGSVSVSEKGFFGFDFMQELDGREIEQEDVMGVVRYVDPMELLQDWNLSDCLKVTLTDNETGAVWEFDGFEWSMIQDRRILPGEQKLFE